MLHNVCLNFSDVTGIQVMFPPDSDNPIDWHAAVDSILPRKDVDGLRSENIGKLVFGVKKNSYILPPAAKACFRMVRHTGFEVECFIVTNASLRNRCLTLLTLNVIKFVSNLQS